MAIQGSIPLPRLLGAAALAAALGACQPSAPPAQDALPASDGATVATALPWGLDPGERINFQCGELGLGVTFEEGGNTARLSYSGQRLELPAADAAIGSRYADADGNQFTTRGDDEALLVLAGQERRDCVRSNRSSPWAVATDAGVTFRAVGQEPGWLVEVTDDPTDGGASMTAHLDYGQRLLEATGMQREGDAWSGESADGTSISLAVEERVCSDPMSGEQFRAAATLVVDGEEYLGCGAWLAAD